MEHITLINKIIEAEQEAQRLAAEALKKRESMHSELKVARSTLRDSYFGRAKLRIDKIREREAALAVEQLAELDSTYTKNLASIESAFKQNEAQWVDTLFGMIVKPSNS